MPAPDSCSFFSGYLLFREEKSSSRFEAEVCGRPFIQGEVSWMFLIDQWISRHYNYSKNWVWLLMQLAVPRLVISATTEYLTNNYRILKRHLNFMVDPPGSKHTYTNTLVLLTPHSRKTNEGISSSCSAPWKRGSRGRPQRLYEGSWSRDRP